MKITLIQNNAVHSIVLPDKISGQYFIGHTNAEGREEPLLSVVPNKNCWQVECGMRSYIIAADGKSDNIRKFIIKDGVSNIWICIRKTEERALLLFEPNTERELVFSKYTLRSSVTIGSDPKNTVQLASGLAPATAAEIRYDNGTAFYRECTPKTRTFINGVRTSEKKLAAGDNIFIPGYTIIFGKDMLAFNNTCALTINGSALEPYFYPEKQQDEIQQYFDEEKLNPLFTVAPRFYRAIEPCNIEVAMPPSAHLENKRPAILSMGPSFTMGTASAATAAITVVNGVDQGRDITAMLPTIVMACSMMLSAIVWPVISRSYESAHNAREEKRRKKYYLNYIEDIKAEIASAAQRQRDWLFAEYPSPARLGELVEQRTVRLWERHSGHEDFMTVCVGIGDIPLLGSITFEDNRDPIKKDILVDLMDKLREERHIIEKAPVPVALKAHRMIGIFGQRDKAVSFVHSIVAQLAAFHSYEELKLAVFYDPADSADWDWIRWLPHTWNSDRTVRYVATTPDELKTVTAQLEALVGSEGEIVSAPKCHYLILFAGGGHYERTDLAADIMTSRFSSHFTVITMFDDIGSLPKECSMVVQAGEQLSLYSADQCDAVKVSPFSVQAGDIRRLAVSLANIRLNSAANKFQLPSVLTFLEMYGVRYAEELNLAKRWSSNNPVNSLAVPIGMEQKGELCMLDLHQKAHGPHGLIAGTTGSGKSEFIMTYILSLAVNFSPREVSFVLIDYKGGGMAEAFSRLPHVAGIITNLDGAAVNRSLISIESELRRRQKVFLETGRQLGTTVNDIYTYQRLSRENSSMQPMQHMFIISDEFAELKKQQPEFMDKLISAARIGRSLGVHLILATQKPSGVVNDQIWSNSRFRICLKVQNREDSTEVIRRPDAAALTHTGRFYFQVGYNEVFELGQSAWCGADYTPFEEEQTGSKDSIAIVDNVGRIIAERFCHRSNNVRRERLGSQIEVIVKHISDVAAIEGCRAEPLWLDTIPTDILAADTIEKYGYINDGTAVEAVVGEYDVPELQEQRLMTVSAGDGNIFLCGSEGSGKTSFLFAYIHGILSNCSPKKSVFYILDFSSETLRAFEGYNGVGSVITLTQRDKLESLISYLTIQIARRREKLATVSGGFAVYSADADDMPAINVVISNYGAFRESFEDCESALEALMRDGPKLGIYFLVTALAATEVKYRMLQSFRQIFVMQLNDGSYTSVIGSTNGKTPSVARGRGLMTDSDGLVCEFQTAFLSRDDVFGFVQKDARRINAKWNSAHAFRIRSLPERYTVDMAKEYSVEGKPLCVPIALDTQFAEPVYADLTERVTLLLHGGTDIRSVTEAVIAYAAEGARVILLDPDSVFGAADCCEYVAGAAVAERIPELYQEALERYHSVKAFPEEQQGVFGGERLLIVCCSVNGCQTHIQQAVISELAGKDDTAVRHEISERMKMLDVLLHGALVDHGVHILLCEKASALHRFTSARWFVDNCRLNRYLWFGAKLSSEDVFRHQKLQESRTEFGEDIGYFVSNGKAQTVKFMTSEEIQYG